VIPLRDRLISSIIAICLSNFFSSDPPVMARPFV